MTCPKSLAGHWQSWDLNKDSQTQRPLSPPAHHVTWGLEQVSVSTQELTGTVEGDQGLLGKL